MSATAYGRLPSVARNMNERLVLKKADVQAAISRFLLANGCFTSHSRRSRILR